MSASGANPIVPPSLNAMLCEYARPEPDSLTLIAAGIRRYPRDVRLKLALVYDGPWEPIVNGPFKLIIEQANGEPLITTDLSDSQGSRKGQGLSDYLGSQNPGAAVHLPVSFELSPLPPEVPAGIYALRLVVGDLSTTIPFQTDPVEAPQEPDEASSADADSAPPL